jgi:hypothetical protein
VDLDISIRSHWREAKHTLLGNILRHADILGGCYIALSASRRSVCSLCDSVPILQEHINASPFDEILRRGLNIALLLRKRRRETLFVGSRIFDGQSSGSWNALNPEVVKAAGSEI